MKHDNATTQTFRRGSYVRLSGLCYGTYDGEIRYLRDWLRQRNQWLYAHYCQGTP